MLVCDLCHSELKCSCLGGQRVPQSEVAQTIIKDYAGMSTRAQAKASGDKVSHDTIRRAKLAVDADASPTTQGKVEGLDGKMYRAHLIDKGTHDAIMADLVARPDVNNVQRAKDFGVSEASIRTSKKKLLDSRPPAAVEVVEMAPELDATPTRFKIKRPDMQQLYAKAGPSVHDWIDTYALWPKKMQDQAYQLFVSLVMIGDL